MLEGTMKHPNKEMGGEKKVMKQRRNRSILQNDTCRALSDVSAHTRSLKRRGIRQHNERRRRHPCKEADRET
jgi:hypothetical protein